MEFVDLDETLAQIDAQPGPLELLLAWEQTVFRPLASHDQAALTTFLESLSDSTRRFYTLASYDEAQAATLIAAIGQWRKLVCVAVAGSDILAMVEFSFEMPAGAEPARYQAAGAALDETQAVRFGPVVADTLHGAGLANALMEAVVAIASHFERQQLVMWGGVFAENSRARAFYQRHGFVEVGQFQDSNGDTCIDMWKTSVRLAASGSAHN